MNRRRTPSPAVADFVRMAHQLRQRRQAIRDRMTMGELWPLPDLTDEEMGEEAVRLVKASRRYRARLR